MGRRFCELVARKGDELAGRHGLRVLFAAVGTGSHGSLLSSAGLTAAELLAVAAEIELRATSASAAGVEPMFPDHVRPGVELISAGGADLLVEATPLDPHGGRLAIAHLEAGPRPWYGRDHRQ